MTTPPGSSAAPIAPRIRLGPLTARETVLDGGWWPRSGDVYAELPGLVLAIDHRFGPVRRMVLSAAGWADHPRHIRVESRTIRLDFFDSQPISVATAVCDGGRRIDLLVVAPGESIGTAEAAMTMAATTENAVLPGNIADAASIAPRQASDSDQV
ncbi:MAG TPA: DUF5994 family protein [Mycobacterium sp.]|nr:DUF5994 family protein [Micromonosporaceae bacterium]